MVEPITIAVGIGMFAVGMISSSSPIRKAFDQISNTLLPVSIQSPAEAIEQRWRRIIDEETYLLLMRGWGYVPEKAIELFNTAQRLLGPAELINLYRRELVSEEEFYALMKRNKITQETANNLLTSTEFMPGAGDLIRWLVREVFRDDIAEKFGYDEDFPPRIIEEGAKIGIREDTLKNFWRAHWELPSVSLAFEMFHRLRPEFEKEVPVTEEDIDTLLKIADMTPYWRERIMKVSFVLPTRVDIRRMVRSGDITPEDAEILYNKLGYDAVNARRLANLAVDMATEDERALTRSLIEKAFDVGEINRETAVNLLIALRYTEKDAELIISIKERVGAEKLQDKQIDILEELFSRGAMNEDELITALDNIGIAAIRRDLIVLTAKAKKLRKSLLPTKDDLKVFFLKNLISRDVTALRLEEIGFKNTDAELFLTAWGA